MLTGTKRRWEKSLTVTNINWNKTSKSKKHWLEKTLNIKKAEWDKKLNGKKADWEKLKTSPGKNVKHKNINKSTKGIRGKPLIFCFLLLQSRKTFPKQVLILPTYRDYILLHHFQSRFFTIWHYGISYFWHYFNSMFFTIRHYVPFGISYVQHYFLSTFFPIQLNVLFGIFLPSFLCPFVVLSHSMFCPFDVFYHSTFFPSNFCPIWRFCPSTFFTVSVFYFDIFSVNHFFWLIPIFYGPCWVIRLKFQPSGNIDYCKLQGKGGHSLD